GFRPDGEESAAGDRAGMRAHRPGRRLLCEAQALPQRGFLYGADLPVDGLPLDHVPGPVRHSTNVGLDRAVGRNAAGSGAKNCPSAANLPGPRHAPLRAHRPTQLSNDPDFLAVVTFGYALDRA